MTNFLTILIYLVTAAVIASTVAVYLMPVPIPFTVSISNRGKMGSMPRARKFHTTY